MRRTSRQIVEYNPELLEVNGDIMLFDFGCLISFDIYLNDYWIEDCFVIYWFYFNENENRDDAAEIELART